MSQSAREGDAGYRPLRIADLPRGLQPREQLKAVGAANVADDVLVAIILRIGIPGLNAAEAARRLLVEFGSLERLSKATVGEIVARKIPGIGETKALQVVAGLELGRRASYQELAKAQDEDVRIGSTQDVAALLQPLVYGSMQERFFVILLGPRNKVLGCPREIAKGQRDEVGLSTNLVFEQPMKEGARAIVVAHNHPAGDPEPSEEDIELTRKLIEAGKLLNIPVYDHVVIGRPTEEHLGFFSIAASGLVKFD